MVFSSVLFLCLFLPVTAGLYALVPRAWKNPVLLLASLCFYAFGEPVYLLLMLGSIGLNYAGGLLVGKARSVKLKKTALILCVLANLGILGFFKYGDFLTDTFNALTGQQVDLLGLALPVGISFYTFQALSYVVDVYRGEAEPQKNIFTFGLYICLFPQLIAGPIVRYPELTGELARRQETGEDFFEGYFRFSVGLCKKAVLANQIGTLWTEISGLRQPSAATAWLGAFAYGLQIYFDFSGYSDMAVGLGRMFGFHFPENFRYPYEADSITEFWRRWHITLSAWFREYVYIPLGGSRRGRLKTLRNLFIVWTLTGLWHGAGWNFILWGLWFFLLLAGEKFLWGRAFAKLPGFFRHLLTAALLTFGWMLFACDTPAGLAGYLACAFGKNGAGDASVCYYLLSYGVLLAVCILGCTRLPAKAAEKLVKNRPLLGFWGKTGLMLLFTALSLVFLTADGYNPFLYFRF